MTSETPKIIKSYCGTCSGETNHSVLGENTESHRDEYMCDITYQIIQCNGCERKGFRKVFYDIESAYPSSHENDEWEVPEDIEIYPKEIANHNSIYHSHHIPNIVYKIYSQVISATKEEATILSGLGLRGTIEAICNDLEIKGKSLEARINKLATSGYISKKDAERLHGIRFLGNDAAHQIKEPNKQSLMIALKIVEHLINTVYVLDNEARDNLDTTISDYPLFEKMLKEAVSEHDQGNEYPIAEYLKENLRRVRAAMSQLEQELINKINSGEFVELSVGKKDRYKNSQDDHQYFIVN